MNSRTHSGFTLLEVLLAVFLLGMSLSIFFGAANQGLAVIAEARAFEQGREYLHLLELLAPLVPNTLEEGIEEGDFVAPDGETVRWTRETTLAGPEGDGFYHLRNTVRWGDSGTPREETTETYLHQPTAQRELTPTQAPD